MSDPIQVKVAAAITQLVMAIDEAMDGDGVVTPEEAIQIGEDLALDVVEDLAQGRDLRVLLLEVGHALAELLHRDPVQLLRAAVRLEDLAAELAEAGHPKRSARKARHAGVLRDRAERRA